ncbi:hypothetical protein [Paenibacillus piri]|uniref:DUF2642 domain-containing protein n=1 Tax=Paenibacillus piri TaxID=2547395 RepID=A0A4R5KK40_9BACL|nr:hypothetical protein [Paenibacillus piri]TDF95901.1 hypothetical protein E1757_19460 [Paenibacillus piri]
MISEELLDQYRVEGTLLRVVRDADPKNDVKGIVVAWDDETVMIRKQNRRIVKLDRNHHYQPFANDRDIGWIGR